MKFKKLLNSFLAICTMSQSAFAAFTLNGTRYIYNGDMKNISIEIDNASKSTYGGQVWIDNLDKGNDEVSFYTVTIIL